MARRWGAGSLLVVACLAASSTAELSVGPAFLWTAAGSLQSSPERLASRTEYQETSLDHVAELAGNLSQASGAADLVTVFSGPQVSLRRMAAAQASPAEALLRSQVQGSSEAVQYPFVFSQGSSWEQGLRPAGSELWVGGECGRLASQPLSALPQALASGAARTLLLCVDDCADSGCLERALASVQQHAASKGLSTAFAYLPHTPGQGAAEVLQGVTAGAVTSTQQRRLQQLTASGSTVLCNAKCQSQVKLYEAFILCALLLSSLFTGLLCMHALGVPDRFEKPKDTGSSRQE